MTAFFWAGNSNNIVFLQFVLHCQDNVAENWPTPCPYFSSEWKIGQHPALAESYLHMVSTTDEDDIAIPRH